MIIFTYINWAKLLPWPQSQMTLRRVNKYLVWSYWYDHIFLYKLSYTVLLTSVLNDSSESQQEPDVIMLIWSCWYDHMYIYKWSKSVILTSVLNDCLESQQVGGVIMSYHYDHIHLIISLIWSHHPVLLLDTDSWYIISSSLVGLTKI